jgi:type VI protein secretion system component Hcp
MKLFGKTATSMTVPVTIYFVSVGPAGSLVNYYSVQLYGVFVTDVTQNAQNSATGLPTETVTLLATKYKYNDLTLGHSAGVSWDCATNTP